MIKEADTPGIGTSAVSTNLCPYVGIIQIRSRVKALQPTLSLLDTQAPLFVTYYTTVFSFLQSVSENLHLTLFIFMK